MTAKDTGPLDWRIAIVDKSGRPTQEFQRRWATQRANNALIGTITFGTGAPTGMPDDGAEYVDTTKLPWVLYIGENGVWNIVGVQDFTDLDDVPGNYTNAGGKLVRVNGNATGLEFDSPSIVLDSFGNTSGDILFRGNSTWQVLGPGNATEVLTTGGPGAPPAWATGGGGGGGALSLISEVVTSGSQSTIAFTSIPATFKHLELWFSGRGTASALSAALNLIANSNTTGIYSYERIFHSGPVATADESLGASSFSPAGLTAANAVVSSSTFARYTIYDYLGALWGKRIECTNSFSNSGSNDTSFGITAAGMINLTSAITRLDLTLSSGDFVDGSIASLYGRS